MTEPDHHTDAELPLAGWVTRTWTQLGDDERGQWLRARRPPDLRDH